MTSVLVDRHHAGLYHSLQLLGRRLGWTLYTPVGHEWWDEGYWQFGAVYGDDRLAQQYLLSPQWRTSLPSLRWTVDDEFPGTVINGALLSWAKAYPWDIVIATVQENQQGFARFAREVGAKFVVQVGNTGQQIDWSLNPLVINSSEMPGGVRVGQEFDSDGLFAFADPYYAKRYSIASFVNCMPRIECWPTLTAAQGSMPRHSFGVYGIDGPDGNVKPITTTAFLMAEAGWGWHDKVHGDGYGHVIHYWAARGRPLIGHASHYAGKNASVFWRDLETCIDLDKHPLSEAVALIEQISDDAEWHADMCRAIRKVFDETTDWEGDAAKVRELLG